MGCFVLANYCVDNGMYSAIIVLLFVTLDLNVNNINFGLGEYLISIN